MGIDKNMVDMIKALYKNPQFRTQANENFSPYYTQDSGIRQGCPLSPYLFSIVMTIIFEDIYWNCMNKKTT